MWGPYEVKKEAFDLGVKRKQLLDGGNIRYWADDRLYRKDQIAINCFHAMAGVDELYPNGGLFGTGFKMWGLNGTRRVLIECTKKVKNKRTNTCCSIRSISRKISTEVSTPQNGIAAASIILSRTHLRTTSSL
jgi:hypothetical protein